VSGSKQTNVKNIDFTEFAAYPSNNHRMPICCDVMYDRMKQEDEILFAPQKGKGATVKIRYYKR